jgi:hypothetical protein
MYLPELLIASAACVSCRRQIATQASALAYCLRGWASRTTRFLGFNCPNGVGAVPAVSLRILDPSPASGHRSDAGSSAARPPRCSRLPSPFASTRSAEGEPGTQVGLLEQGYAAVQVARGVAERAAVPRNGKREARDA